MNKATIKTKLNWLRKETDKTLGVKVTIKKIQEDYYECHIMTKTGLSLGSSSFWFFEGKTQDSIFGISSGAFTYQNITPIITSIRRQYKKEFNK